MAKLTLLDMVQDILSDMSSDEVNSISDTVESLQVAGIIKSTYLAMIADTFWPREAKRVQLTPLSSTDTPTHFKLPDNIEKLAYIKYDCQASGATKTAWKELTYRTPEDFLYYSLAQDSSASNIDTVTDSSGTVLYIINDHAPTYWTSFDDEYVIMDSYDSTVDDTLQASKMIAYAEVEPSWSMTDSFVPTEIPAKAFPFLLAEAKSNCFITIKQEANPKVEQIANRLRNKAKHDKFIAQQNDNYPDYGRV